MCILYAPERTRKTYNCFLFFSHECLSQETIGNIVITFSSRFKKYVLNLKYNMILVNIALCHLIKKFFSQRTDMVFLNVNLRQFDKTGKPNTGVFPADTKGIFKLIPFHPRKYTHEGAKIMTHMVLCMIIIIYN